MVFPLIRSELTSELYFSQFWTAMCRTDAHLAIVSGLTMNYNGYDVVETAYETLALVVASRCLCIAYRLRRRAACSPYAPSIEISGRDTVTVPTAAAAV
jgi:hypothetical protein